MKTKTLIVSGALIAASLLLKLFAVPPLVAPALMGAAAVVAGIPVATRALRSAVQRHISIEALVTVAAGGAMAIGEFWEAAAVTFLFNLGNYLEARTMARTRGVIGSLLELAPDTALVVRDDRWVEVDAAEVASGDMVVVRPGAQVPVDGVVRTGGSSIDESAITGEPYPRGVEPEDEVFAGTFNQAGLLTVEATAAGRDTTLARIIERVEEAQEAKAPTQRFMERFSRWYTPAIIIGAGVMFAITRNIELALTILVIGCPGALVISTPVSVVAGIGGAAKQGILMKGGAHLETSGRITAVALDKTGTLTRGRPEVSRVVSLEQEVLYWAALAEKGTEHPLSHAVLRAVDDTDRVPNPDRVTVLAGRGIEAEYQGHSILVGSPRLMEERGYGTDHYEELAGDGTADGGTANAEGTETPVLVALDGRLIGALFIADPIRSDAREAIASLYRTGVKKVVMLTGDNLDTARHVGGELGISDVYAGLLPEEKLERIRELQREGHVTAMVGDGVNDAPALAAADVGIAMGAAGNDVAIETADIALMRDELTLLAQAVRRARMTLNNIRQNVVVAMVTVSVLLVGVLAGEVHMAGGMLIHEASVMLVVLNAMRLLSGARETRSRPQRAPERQLETV